MADDNKIDSIVTGLVREWLYRRGHAELLKMFDEETETDSTQTMSSTASLVSALGLSTLYKRNQEAGRPLVSVLEVLTSHFCKDRNAMPELSVEGNEGASAQPSGPDEGFHSLPSRMIHPAPIAPPEALSQAAPSVASQSFWDRMNAKKAGTVDSALSSVPPSEAPAAAQEPLFRAAGSDTTVCAPFASINDIQPVAEPGEEWQGIPDRVEHVEVADDADAGTRAAPNPGVFEAIADAPRRDLLPAAAEPLSAPIAPIVPASKSGGSSFFERMAAKKAADAAAAAGSSISTAVELILSPVSAPGIIAPITVPVPVVPQPAAIAPVGASGSTFFERIAAKKAEDAAAAAAAMASAPSPAVTPIPVVPVPAPAALSFFERMAAKKAADSVAATAWAGASAVVEPAPVAASAPVTAVATAPSAGGGTFFERMAAKKAAESAAASVQAPVAASATAAAPASAPPSAVFTAPDGRVFTDRGEYRRYVFVTFYMFSNRSGETLTKAPGEIEGQPFSLEDLTDCTVRLCDASDTVQADRLTRCRILIAASSESVFLRNCTDCIITVACKQLRTRDCMRCTIYLYSKTEPVIEASANMVFAPFNAAVPRLEEAMRASALNPERNLWDRIFDFSKDTDSAALPAPHWRVQAASEWTEWVVDDLPGVTDTPVNPVPMSRDDGLALADGAHGMLSFDIRNVSQAQAEAMMAESGAGEEEGARAEG